MGWTIAQQKVIDTRNKNLLVSAAAGSGKTAVLVERIISMISEGDHPIDIDHLLVVTFTNAAAAEMRGRIGKAIDEKLQKEPGNEHLQKQISLLQSAQITTIHSFCLNVIRNYFHRIDLDPAFKIAEESEITLMKSDVLSDLLERWYDEGREDFHAFIESYSYSKSDAPIEELILQLYNFSMSDPWPKSWIAEKRRMFDLKSVEEMSDAPWMKELLSYVDAVLCDLLVKNEEALSLCNDPDGPAAYAPALSSDRALLCMLKEAGSYEKCVQSFQTIAFDRLSNKKQEGLADWKKDKVKELREEVKKGIKDLAGQFFFQPPQEMLKDLQAVGEIMQVLFDLTLEFMDDFAKKKEEKNLIDFNDLEHFALKILVSEKKDERETVEETAEEKEADDKRTEADDKRTEADDKRTEADDKRTEAEDIRTEAEDIVTEIDDNETEANEKGTGNSERDSDADVDSTKSLLPTQAALELSEQFEEILIDEYQDSNMVQETILKSISREAVGNPNRFMVGDVKQSIYKFRLAMPEIFMEKYGKYSCDELMEDGQVNNYQRIDLDKNFRSRKTVLDYVNKVFEQIMQKPVGGIVYDDAASLKYGELYEGILQKPADEVNSNKKENEADSKSDIKKISTENKLNQVSEAEDTMQSETSMNRIAVDVELLLVTDEAVKIKQDSEKDTQEAAGEQRDASETYLKNGENSGEATEEDPEEAVYTKKEIEARMIARKIRELTDPVNGMLVFDKKANNYRPAAFRDIVILLRSMSNWSEVFVNTLMQEGISSYADSGTGYFQTLEIMTVINMLRIIDNPRQDIPLVGVLYSPIVGITSTELAMIRTDARNVSMYTALLSYAKEGSYVELKEKAASFIEKLEFFRSIVNHKPIHELIQIVLDQTGYYYYVCAMSGGDRRKANIDMLISRAVSFEKGSYSGLFHFIRYIEKLHKYEVDFGEAATAGEQDNTVRIMSIHKSKGLEFPIVFVAGMNKQFNTQDIRSNIVLHSELGIGPEYIDSKARTKVPTLIKKVIQKKVQIENMGEELRVLYVAMTRAKEKLILTGYLKSIDEVKKKNFSFFEILSAKSYLDWVLPATVNKIGWIPETINNSLVSKEDGISITVCHKNNLLKEEVTKQIFLRKDEEELLAIHPDTVYDQGLKEEVKRRFNYSYSHQKEAGLKVKMTVSELKKLGQLADEELSVNLFENQKQPECGQKNINQIDSMETDLVHNKEKCEDKNRQDEEQINKSEVNQEYNQDRSNSSDLPLPEMNATVPDFISKKEVAISGTDRGTLYHKVLELIQLIRISNEDDLKQELKRLVREKHLKESDLKLLNLDYINKFILSSIADRMRQAEYSNKLYREKQFVIGIKAAEVMQNIDSDELILIQGIIDVFFEEEQELVLLDYKSDLVTDVEQLVNRYKVQLEYYRKALEQMLNKRVKEMIIYSLPLGKEIRID